MATVEQVAKDALKMIMVQGADAPLDADDYADFITALNDYMHQLAAEGVNLGYTEVSSIQDEVTVPLGALRGIKANMAINVSPSYGGVISEALILTAKQGKQTMRLIGQRIGKTRYPSTLPRGSGNYDSFSMGDNYYPDLEASILTETTGTIGLEDNT
jgi:hypothetical protein